MEVRLIPQSTNINFTSKYMKTKNLSLKDIMVSKLIYKSDKTLVKDVFQKSDTIETFFNRYKSHIEGKAKITRVKNDEFINFNTVNPPNKLTPYRSGVWSQFKCMYATNFASYFKRGEDVYLLDDDSNRSSLFAKRLIGRDGKTIYSFARKPEIGFEKTVIYDEKNQVVIRKDFEGRSPNDIEIYDLDFNPKKLVHTTYEKTQNGHVYPFAHKTIYEPDGAVTNIEEAYDELGNLLFYNHVTTANGMEVCRFYKDLKSPDILGVCD